MKRALALLLSASLTLSLAACGGGGGGTSQAGGSSGPASSGGTGELTATQQIIQEAQGMTLEELAQKAIEESNGQKFYGVGNSSRGATALPLFVEYLQSIDPSYTLEFEWQQPKNNKIFDQLTSDSLKDTGTFAMTLIQDGNQIESKMVQTGILDTFIPKDWADANGTTAEEYNGYLPLQTLNKVFMYNNTGSKTFDNCWDFVGEDAHGLFMDIDSELVGKNFLYMLTEDTYAGWLKDAFEALSADEQAYFQPTIDEMASEAESLGLGSCYIGDILERREEQARILGCPRHVVPAVMLVIGHPTEGQRRRKKPVRLPLADIVFEDRYEKRDAARLLEDLRPKAPASRELADWARAFCERKWNSDFSREMTRSTAAILADFATDVSRSSSSSQF